MRRPVSLGAGTAHLLDRLPALIAGWPCRPDADDGGDAPRLELKREGGVFTITAPWLDRPVRETDPFRAAANLAVDLLEAWLDENPDRLAVHCGAVEFAGRVVLFPGRSKAGKSTLCARLAAHGLPVFGDDVLCLTGPQDRTAMSLGLFPRLRLPLPPHASEGFRTFVGAHCGPANDRYAYLALPETQSPRFGRTAPLGAVVLLNRAKGAPARLASVETGDGVQELIVQNLSPELSMTEAVPRLIRTLAGLPCLCLTYWDLDEAAQVLADHFRAWDDASPVAQDAAMAEARPSDGPATRPARLRGAYRQRPGIARHDADGDAFLVDRDSDAVLRLNTVSAAIWTLLKDGADVEHCSGMLAAAFPEVERDRIEADVESHFATLRDAGLIVTA